MHRATFIIRCAYDLYTLWLCFQVPTQILYSKVISKKIKKEKRNDVGKQTSNIFLSFQVPNTENEESFHFFFLHSLKSRCKQALKESSIYFRRITFGMQNKFLRKVKTLWKITLGHNL